MVYNVNDRLDHVGKRFREIKATTGTYSRGTVTIPNVVFTHVDIDREEIAIHDAVLLEDEIRSFSFDSKDIRPLLGKPKGGDRIRIIGAEGLETYEILPVNNRAWQWTTLSKKRVRVHCREIVS